MLQEALRVFYFELVLDNNFSIVVYRYAYSYYPFPIFVLKGPAVTFSESQNEIRSPPPVLGQHTTEVLKAELGLDDDNIARLHQENIVYSAK